MKQGMKSVVAIMIALSVIVVSGSASGESDLEAYINQARQAGMSESARGNVQMAAAMISGQASIVFRESEPGGRWWASYRSNACPVPGLSAAQQAERNERLAQELAPAVEVLKVLADTDHSGFVSTAEGETFRARFEFGRLAAQVKAAGSDDVPSLMRASGLDSLACEARRAEFAALLEADRSGGVDLLARATEE